MEYTLIIFITTLLVATISNVLLKRFELPTILGYIISGIFISLTFDIKDESHALSHLAEFGIVFLMFMIGLEFSIKHLKSMKKEVFLYGSLQVLITGLVFTLISYYLFGIDIKLSIVLGYALSLSSTAIVLKVLNERSQIHTGYGRISVGVLIFQDLAVIPLLLMISIFTSNDKSLSLLLLDTLLGAIVVFFIIFVAGKRFIEKFLEWILESNSEEIFLISVLFIVITSAFISDIFGFSFTLGAFLAGMTIAETRFRYRIEADLTPFRDILLGIFFVTIGMSIDFKVAFENIFIIIPLLLMILLIKALIIFFIIRLFTQSRTALKSALALFEVGEFALVLISLSKGGGLMDERVAQITTVIVVLSMIIAPFVLKSLKSIADRLISEPQVEIEPIESVGYKDHLIICGYGDLGQKLASRFKKLGLFYVVIEHDPLLVKKGREDNQPVILANAAQRAVLEAVNITESLAVMVAIDNPKKLRLVCENIASFDADINSIVKVKNSSQEAIIKDLKISHVVNESEKMASILMEEAVKCRL
jgi:CPA2 family monovalent cation:H+ antiporter-2